MANDTRQADPDLRKKKIDRVRKLLALAKGSSDHEAAAALDKAQQLMEAEGITEQEMQAQAATEAFSETGAAKRVPSWEDKLACAIGRAFACDAIHHRGRWSFVGIDPLPEIAIYAFDVLRRQRLRAREVYVEKHLSRVTVRKNKVRRADLYCDGWIDTAVSKARRMARRPEDTGAVRAYKALTYPALIDLKAVDRNGDRTLRDYEMRDLHRGRLHGADAELRVGVGLQGQPAAMIEN
jgi:hypothetical protein